MLLLCALFVSVFTGCEDEKMTDKEYEELAQANAAANAKKVVWTISKGDKTYDVTLDMFTYYLAYNEADAYTLFQTNAEYYKLFYGEDVDFWKIPADENNHTMAESYKATVEASMLYTILMYYEAKEAGLTLTDAREKKLDSTTDAFLAQFSPEERARCGMTREVIRANYERIFLADQYSSVAAATVKVDKDAIAATVDKEQYRVFQTNYLYLTKSTDNEELTKIAGDSAQRLKTMQDCLADAESGMTLENIQKKYADILTYRTQDFVRANTTNMDPEYVSLVTAMQKGDIKLLDLSYGIYVVELVDCSTYYGYEDAVKLAIQEAQNKGINSIFSEIEKTYTITKTDVWNELEMGTILRANAKK